MVDMDLGNLKMLRETLCVAQHTMNIAQVSRAAEHSIRLQELINQIDVLRPLGSDGKHGRLHTGKCGCDYATVLRDFEIDEKAYTHD